MLTYLSEPKQRLRSMANGMEKNPVRWTDQSVTKLEVEQMITSLDTADNEVEIVKQLQTQKLSEARSFSNSATLLADKIENLALGFHSGDDAKLLEYNIKPRKSRSIKSSPDLTLQPSLEDDTDGEGFIVSTTADAKADYYEWQKGAGVNAADVNTIPELKMFKTTKKTYFVDDEVPKGVRVFYKVRAANAAGFGPWSQPVSRVQ